MVNIDHDAPKVTVGMATGQTQRSTGTGKLNLSKLPANFPFTGHIMPGFRHNLIDEVPLCDADCTVTFTSAAVVVRDLHGSPVLTGWKEQAGLSLWKIALQPDETTLPSMTYDANKTTIKAYSAYDLPIVRAYRPSR